MPNEEEEVLKKGKDPQYAYPLQKFLKTHPKNNEFSKLGESSLNDEDLARLEVIKNIVRTAEVEINSIASSLNQKKEVRTMHLPEPAYFDEDFDQKSYIQDLVAAKIQGMRIVEQDTATSKVKKMMILKQALEAVSDRKSDNPDTKRSTKSFQVTDVGSNTAFPTNETFRSQSSAAKQMDTDTSASKNPNQSQPRSSEHLVKHATLSQTTPCGKQQKANEKNTTLTVTNHKLVEIKSDITGEITEIPIPMNPQLTVQRMPSVNIRSQLIEQKIPSLDIYPEDENNSQPEKASNVALLQSEHSDGKYSMKKVKINLPETRKSLEDKGDNEINTSDYFENAQNNEKHLDKYDTGPISDELNTQNSYKSQRFELSPTKFSLNADSSRSFLFLNHSKNDAQVSSIPLTRKVSKLRKFAIPDVQKIYNPKTNFRKTVSKKVSSVFGDTFYSSKSPYFKAQQAYDSKLYDMPILKTGGSNRYCDSNPKLPRSAEYIPYSKLTVGGFNADEIAKCTTTKDYKKPMEILSQPSTSVVESAHLNKERNIHEGKFIDLGKFSVSSQDQSSGKSLTITKSSEMSAEVKLPSGEEEQSPNEYDDDFDDDSKSNNSQNDIQPNNTQHSSVNNEITKKTEGKPHKKVVSLNLKKKVDIFDFIHCIETKDDSTQSVMDMTSNFKETQTSPRRMETQTTLNLPESSIKKIDIANLTLRDVMELQKSFSLLNASFFKEHTDYSPPEASFQCRNEELKVGNDKNLLLKLNNANDSTKNYLTAPKNTQTSPFKSSHVMTSPTEMVNRILSPIFNEIGIDAQTSPCDINVSLNETNSDEIRPVATQQMPQIANVESQNISLGIRDSPSNCNAAKNPGTSAKNKFTLPQTSSPNVNLKESTDAYTDASHSESSDTHSLGEINLRIFRKKSFIIRRQTKSDSNSNSLVTSSSSDVHMDTSAYAKKSDGELSVGQILTEK